MPVWITGLLNYILFFYDLKKDKMDMENNEYELNELQKRLLEMFQFFHKFCNEQKLTYYALGGTMLGAARHKGFIPWDDDIDVGMPRDDFEKIYKLFKNRTNSKYCIETPSSTDPAYCYAYSKIYDSSTTLIENTRQKLKRGIFIDIFPLDGMGNSEKESKSNYKKISKRIQLLSLRKIELNKGRALIKNIIIILAKLIPSFIISEKRLCRQIDNLCKERPFNEFAWGGNLVGAYGVREIMPREIMGKPQLYQFENIEIFGVEHFDEYLTYIYGDWKKLPPKEKRVSHHDYYLDLNKGYID